MTIRPVWLTSAARADREEAIGSRLVDGLDAHYRLAVILLGDPVLAQDATHDAVARALGSAGQLRDPEAFEGWFRRILVNACRDVGRRQGRRTTQPLAPEDTDRVTYDPNGAWVERDAMGHALSRLSQDHREVVVLRFYADLALDEIARTLRLRPGTVRSRLHYALRQLRAEYDASGRSIEEPHR